MKLDFNLDVDSIKEIAEKSAHEKAKSIALNLVSDHFDSGQYYGHKKGFGYLQIQEVIDSLLTSDSLTSQIEALVKEHWEEALEKAVKYQLERKASKEAFKLVGK